MKPVLTSLQDSPLGQALRGADPAVIVGFQLLHIVGLLLLLTGVLLLALRLFGLGLRRQSTAEVAGIAAPLQNWGLAAAGLSGFAMFTSNAVVYANNPALQLKLLLLAAAVLLQITLVRRLLKRPANGVLPAAVASTSLLLWSGTALAGRAIGFV